TGDYDTGRSQVRTVRLGQLFAYERRQAGVFYNVQLFYRSRTAFSSNRVERGRTHSDNLDAVAGLYGRDGVTGVDRTNEGVVRLNADNVGYLGNVQQRSNARHEVFTGGTGRSQDVAVALTYFSNQLAQVLTQEMTVRGVVCNQYLVHAFRLGSGFSDGAYVLTGNQHVDVATDGLGSRYNVQSSLLQAAVVVFSNYQDAHLDHLRFVLQFIHQLSYVCHLDTSLACSRGFDLQGGQARGDFNTQIGGAHGVQLEICPGGSSGAGRFHEPGRLRSWRPAASSWPSCCSAEMRSAARSDAAQYSQPPAGSAQQSSARRLLRGLR